MIIVGAGGAGLFLASKSNSGNITIIEEHKKLGLPVQCTGILTGEINQILNASIVKKITVNKITQTRIFSPNNYADISIEPNIIIDNEKFIHILSELAEKNGAEIKTNHSYISNSASSIKIKNNDSGKIRTFEDNILIGADGPRSLVAMNNGLNKKRDFLLGLQARVKLKEIEKNRIDFHPYIGEYAWCVPEDETTARIGIAVPLKSSKLETQNSKKLLDDFLKKYPGKKLETQAGLIPLYKPGAKIASIENNFSAALIGDSASQIKNTTGGGIIPGLKSAEILSRGLDTYQKNLKELNRELYVHYILHQALRNYSGKDWDRLVHKVKNDKIQEALSKYNRDNAGKLLLALSSKKGMISEGLIALGKFF